MIGGFCANYAHSMCRIFLLAEMAFRARNIEHVAKTRIFTSTIRWLSAWHLVDMMSLLAGHSLQKNLKNLPASA